MTDFGKKDDEFDWDAALDEWETKAFSPEVAKDRGTQRPIAPATAPPGNTPAALTPAIPRPAPVPAEATADDSTSLQSTSSRDPSPFLDDSDESEPTSVKIVPNNLVKLAAARAPGGGLGQLFGRPDQPPSGAPRPQELTRPSASELGDREAVVTSAKSIALTSSAPSSRAEDALKRPVPVDERVADGELFDPFADPEARLPEQHNAPTKPPGANTPSATASAPSRFPPEEDETRPRDATVSEGRILLAPVVREHDPDLETSTFELKALGADFIARVKRANADADLADRAEQPRRTGEAARSAPEADDDDVEVEIEVAAAEMSAEELADLDAFEEVGTGELEPIERQEQRAAAEHGVVAPLELSGEPPAIGELEDLEALGLVEEVGPSGEVALRGSERTREPYDATTDDAVEAPTDAQRHAEGATTAMAARAQWLEREARACEELPRRARALLVVSELHALQGQNDVALALAIEARELAPDVALTHVQVRGLSHADAPAEVVESIDRSLSHEAPPGAQLHAQLYAAAVLRANGDDEGARERWNAAATIAPSDVRVVLGRAASALAHAETAGSALEAADTAENHAMARAISAARRIRGLGALQGDADLVVGDSLRRARASLARGAVAEAGAAIGELHAVPELRGGAAWLTFALQGPSAEHRGASLASLAALDDPRARRALAARAIELADTGRLARASEDDETFAAPERLVLAALGGATEEAVRGLAREVGRGGDAYGALVAATDDSKLAGSDTARRALRLGRVLARNESGPAMDDAVRDRATDAPDEMRPLELELARRAERWPDVIDGMLTWQRRAAGPLVAALVAERSGDVTRAKLAYAAVREVNPTNEAALRALAALDSAVNLPTSLLALATELEGVRGALLRLEAASYGSGRALDGDAQATILEQIQRAAPELPMASFLAERSARRSGAIDLALRWIRNRRASATDPLEAALESIREALLVAHADAALATELLEEAHRAHPDDFALRDLFERVSSEPPHDRAAWREARAARAQGDARKLLLLEAAHEYERVGDNEAALRAATAAASESGAGLERIVLERVEVLAGSVARLADELLTLARSAEDPVTRREAYERLADLDLTGRHDAASALLWHRAILEEVGDHAASLRHVEQALSSEGRDDELVPVFSTIAHLLDGTPGGEGTAHAEVATRFMMRAGDWDDTRELAALARRQPVAALWSLRLHNAHARAHDDHASDLESTLAIAERATRAPEVAALLVRAGDAANRLGDLHQAKDLYERASKEDPGDVVAWQRLGDACTRAGDRQGAAAAFESVARSSVVSAHQLAAWYDAAVLWLDEVKDDDRGMAALEQAATIEVTHADVFPRLSSLYAARGARTELAALLERRGAATTDPNERVVIEIERGKVLAEVGDTAAAKVAFETALERQPDHTAALAGYGDLAAATEDWDTAEKSWVRLARLLTSPDEQRLVYLRLGDLYSERAPNLARAELAYREVLKRAPEDEQTMERLVQVYSRQNDPARAIEMQQVLIGRASDATERRGRLIELSLIYEQTSHDPRKAEQALETARRELPADVTVLRALADFYTRHKQAPAVHMLLDRAAADARRAFGAGRFAPALFEVMATVYDLRGKKDASEVVGATLAAFTAAPTTVRGADARAGDPRLDDLLAPDALSPALRALLSRAGDALDVVYPVDARAIHAAVLPASAQALRDLAESLAAGMGIQSLQMYVSPSIGLTVLAAASSPPTLVVGEPLLSPSSQLARTFLLVRALKLVQSRASAFTRVAAKDLPTLIAAWLQAFNPTWQPQGVPTAQLADVARRMAQAIPRRADPDVGLIALEVAGSIGSQAATLGPATVSWANRTALLAVGDPNAALDAIAWTGGQAAGAPRSAQERASWIARTAEAKDLVAYSVSEAYAEARMRAGAAR